ncbi:carboxymethylenebutenolidase [Burkholderia ubonensis]|uniref:dienelactone hydrolase family protein n=1 Tax=Burkholderia ubonensis TaxID=101571 RepID=UPI00075A555C|nr:dienelactone hydrolase family protein [Burkholderia ubonensis]KVM81657.1 carboxymethylenebutenolidase [Burkholderia ubonensis]KVX91644.1 carboxymethylenebutenolidase [Burkholderia ubonensis]
MLTRESHRACFRRVAPALLCLVLALAPPIARAQARMEVIPFESLTMTDDAFLAGREDGKPVTIAGELRLPRAGSERFPLVILLHGSGGISSYVTDWERELLAMGVATFVIDSFTSRGLVSVNDDQAQLGRLVQIEDAYRALAVLAKHPRIDPARVMLMGFSRGGHSTLYASLTRFQRMHAVSAARFAAYVAFYPGCPTAYRDDEDIAPRPVRVFAGTGDDYTPIAPCRAYVERLKAAGRDVSLTEYPGARHVFDGRAFNPPLTLPKAQTLRHCRLAENDLGQVINTDTRQPFSYADACVERGATIGYDEKAAADARKAVAAFVAETLKPAR